MHQDATKSKGSSRYTGVKGCKEESNFPRLGEVRLLSRKCWGGWIEMTGRYCLEAGVTQEGPASLMQRNILWKDNTRPEANSELQFWWQILAFSFLQELIQISFFSVILLLVRAFYRGERPQKQWYLMQLNGERATFFFPPAHHSFFHIWVWEKFANALNYCLTYESAQPSVVGWRSSCTKWVWRAYEMLYSNLFRKPCQFSQLDE